MKKVMSMASLHVAARLVQHLAHLARHVAGERLLAVGDESARRETAAPRGAAPARAASARRPAVAASIARVDVRRGRLPENADQIVGVGTDSGFRTVCPRNRRHPAAVNKVVSDWSIFVCAGRHGVESAMLLDTACNIGEKQREPHGVAATPAGTFMGSPNANFRRVAGRRTGIGGNPRILPWHES